MDLRKSIKNYGYGSLYLTCNDRKAFFFTSSDQRQYALCTYQNVCDALSYLLDNIYIRSGSKLYRQIVGIPMGTNCAPLVADLFLYCYDRDFIISLNHDNQKVQVGKDQEKAQSERDSHSKNRGGKKPN